MRIPRLVTQDSGQDVERDVAAFPQQGATATTGTALPDSIVPVSTETILERLKERDQEDSIMLRSIDDRLEALKSETEQLIRARARIAGVQRPVRPQPDDVVPSHGAAPVALSRAMQILHMLANAPKAATTEEVSNAISGSDPDRIRQTLYDLSSKAKTVDHVGRSTWKISAKGRAKLQEAATR
jgi:hypothetical protein